MAELVAAQVIVTITKQDLFQLVPQYLKKEVSHEKTCPCNRDIHIHSRLRRGAGNLPSKAIGEDGKPLTGAALKSFMTKCTKDACEPKAVDKNGKPLAGAAKASFMKKCESET